MQAIEQERIVTAAAPAKLQWGAVFGGAFLVLGVGWLLTLLGGALGFSIVDATDREALGEGFGIGTAIWLVVSLVAAYFVGGLIAGRFGSQGDRERGVLHGLTVWSVASVVTVSLAYAGLKGMLSAGAGIVSGAVDVAQEAVAGGAQATQALWSQGKDLATSDLAEGVRDDLERELEGLVAETTEGSSAPITREEADRALEGLDGETVQAVATQLMEDDVEGARATLREATGLSKAEVRTLVDRTGEEIQESWNESQVAQAVEASFRDGLDQLTATVADAGGSGLSQAEVRKAVDQIDGPLLAEVGGELIAGRPEAAKRALRRETTLEEEDIDALVASASNAVDERVSAVREQVAAVAESAADYTEAVLWTWFCAAALALVAAAAGGAVGTAKRERETIAVSTRSTPV